ncbi:MAG: phosphatidylglycerol lysyltransferase domain-containing protein [Lachnospiraceae bacterium]|nr:phosphatidylglycerol lysyltransferase domain-containing protein [Lachnospiraceae bacterium]
MDFYIPTLLDIDLIKSAMRGNEKLTCEMSPANIILWARYYRTQIAFWNGEIVFRSEWDNGKVSYSCNILNAKKPRELFDRLIAFAKEEGHTFCMHCMVAQEMDMIDSWYPGCYQICYNRDISDYIYLREKLASLSGKKLHGKRNHIHRFEEQNPDWRYETITEENTAECERMAMQWCMKNCMGEMENIEYEKIDESKLVVYALRNREIFGMTGGALRVAGNIVAITLGEPLTEDTFVVHFEKAFSEIQGAYPMINREFVRNELSGYVYVNREEDMGLPGLRKAKLSYRPDILLEKGVITAC